jgi:hypothetical protein
MMAPSGVEPPLPDWSDGSATGVVGVVCAAVPVLVGVDPDLVIVDLEVVLN